LAIFPGYELPLPSDDLTLINAFRAPPSRRAGPSRNARLQLDNDLQQQLLWRPDMPMGR